MSIKMTEFYWPNKGRGFTYTKIKISKSGRPNKLDWLDASRKSIQLYPGLADWCKGNIEYKKLLMILKINEISNQDIAEQYLKYYHLKLPAQPPRKDNGMDQAYSNDYFDYLDSNKESIANEIIYLRLVKKWSLTSLKARYDLNNQNIRNIFN